MKRIYLIEHWKEGYWSQDKGYWSQDRGKFGGILFATRYVSEFHAEQACKYDIKAKGPVFVVKGFEER